MTAGAQCDQIILAVATAKTAELHMVHLQVLPASAGLASPAITFEGLPMEFPVRFGLATHPPLHQNWFENLLNGMDSGFGSP